MGRVRDRGNEKTTAEASGDLHTLHKITQSIAINASPEAVWKVLTDPDAGPRWRNAEFITDWTVPGSSFEIIGRIGSQRHLAKGNVIMARAPEILEYSFWSRMFGLADQPENYSRVRLSLAPDGARTILTVENDVPPSPIRRGIGWEIGPESGWKHAHFYWRTTLPILKDVVEHGSDF